MKSDVELNKDVLSRLELEPKIDAAALGVSVEEGVVTLRGSVESDRDRLTIERAVRDISGVKGVVDDELKVESRTRSRPADADLEKAAAEALKWLVTVPQERISMTVRNGWAQVEGEVEYRHQADSIAAVLKEVSGLKGVKNKLVVAAQSRAA